MDTEQLHVEELVAIKVGRGLYVAWLYGQGKAVSVDRIGTKMRSDQITRGGSSEEVWVLFRRRRDGSPASRAALTASLGIWNTFPARFHVFMQRCPQVRTET